jgi:hypothetical protein
LALRTNFVFGTKNDTAGLLLGFGRNLYSFQKSQSQARFGELAIMVSPKIIKSEYRFGFDNSHLELAASYLFSLKDEPYGGFAGEIFLVDKFFQDLKVGIGIGPFFNKDTGKIVPMATLFVSHPITFVSPNLSLRLDWDRMMHSTGNGMGHGDLDNTSLGLVYALRW